MFVAGQFLFLKFARLTLRERFLPPGPPSARSGVGWVRCLPIVPALEADIVQAGSIKYIEFGFAEHSLISFELTRKNEHSQSLTMQRILLRILLRHAGSPQGTYLIP